MPRNPDVIEREKLLAAAVQRGKFPASRVDHYRAAYDRDPQGTERLIDALVACPQPDGVAAAIAAAEPPAEQVYPMFQHDPEAGTGRIFEARDR